MTTVLIWIIIILMIFYFTTVESGNVKFVTKGKTYSRTIDGDENWSIFGWFWIGIRFLYGIHNFEINKEKENKLGTDPATWIIDHGKEIVNSLRKTVTRPFVGTKVELADRTKIDILISTILSLEDGRKFVFDLKANFDTVRSIIIAAVSDKIKGVKDLGTFIALDKGEGGYFESLIQDQVFQQKLISLTGYRLEAINSPDYNADESMIEAANEEAIAKLKAAAAIATAQGQADALTITSKAEADNLKRLAEAEIQGYMEQIGNIVNGKEKILALQEILRSKAIERTKLNTLVFNGGKTNVNV